MSNQTNRVFVLGAEDPEMAAIAQLLTLAGEKIEHAKTADGIRVNVGTAYKAMSPAPTPEKVWVECARADWPAGVDLNSWGTVRVDHHRPGDPGFGKSPEEFWNSSSIGQIFNLLSGTMSRTGLEGVAVARSTQCVAAYGGAIILRSGEVICECEHPECEVRKDVVSPGPLYLIAAADHCLAAAYQGSCPGVSPDELLRWRIESRAAFQKKDPKKLLEETERAVATLILALGSPLGEWVADLRHRHTDELPEASCRAGRGYLATIKDRDGRTKIVLGGCGEGSLPGTEPVKNFIENWATAQGLVEIYGDPVRGFAGGYLPAPHDCRMFAVTYEADEYSYCSCCQRQIPYERPK